MAENRPISIRLPSDLLDHYRAVAERSGVPYQRLMKQVLHRGKPPIPPAPTRAAEPRASYGEVDPTSRLRGRATGADLDLLEDWERIEIVDGELVEKALPNFDHASAQFTLSRYLGNGYQGAGDGDRPGGWWFGTEPHIEFERHQVYVPDVAGWRRDRVPKPPRGIPVRVLPDWVCEILSPSTARRDLTQKRHTLHRCRIGHYWVVDPMQRTFTVNRWHENGYLTVLCAAAEETVRAEPFEAVELPLLEVFGPEEDD